MPTVPCQSSRAGAGSHPPTRRRERHLALVRADLALPLERARVGARSRRDGYALRNSNSQPAPPWRAVATGRRRTAIARPRLTKRGWRVAAALLVGLLLAAFSLGRASAADKGPGSPGASVRARAGQASQATRIIVQPGDTLWSIAGRIAPGSDPRVTIERLRRANGLADAGLATGAILVVPLLR